RLADRIPLAEEHLVDLTDEGVGLVARHLTEPWHRLDVDHDALAGQPAAIDWRQVGRSSRGAAGWWTRRADGWEGRSRDPLRASHRLVMSPEPTRLHRDSAAATAAWGAARWCSSTPL